MKFTKKDVEALPPAGNERGMKYYDTENRNLGLIVYPSGRKVFFITYGPKGRRKQMNLGDFGSLTVDDARKLAAEEMVKVYHGRDPKHEKEEKRGRQSFSEWADTYYNDVSCTRKHPREDKRYLGIAKKAFGNKLLEEVTATDVQKVFNKRKDKPAVANRLLATIRACLNEAWRKGFIITNPAAKIQSLPPLPPRRRILSDEEYNRLQKAVQALPDVFNRMAFKIMMETGARMSEVLKAEWSHFDFENQVWHIPQPKSGKPQSLPLTPSLLESLQQLPRPGKYVIAGRDPNKPRLDLKKMWMKLQKNSDLPDVRIHDIRRTFGKQIALRENIHIASRLLRHSDIRVTEKHYAPLTYNELREVLIRRETNNK